METHNQFESWGIVITTEIHNQVFMDKILTPITGHCPWNKSQEDEEMLSLFSNLKYVTNAVGYSSPIHPFRFEDKFNSVIIYFDDEPTEEQFIAVGKRLHAYCLKSLTPLLGFKTSIIKQTNLIEVH